MEKLADYVRWIGNLDFSVYPFREADALILCIISYYDLAPVFAEEKPEHTVSDCIPMIEAGEAKIEITGGDLGNGEVFEAAARSKRFGSLRMSDYETVLRADPPLQFAAVTFHAPDFSFIAYRGTDASIAGWREDCMISFTRTEAQLLSLSYAEHMIDDGVWYIGGHSKGANQAQYAASMLSDGKWEKVRHVYLLDGPGFCPEVLDPELDKRIDEKTTRIIPEFDVIGMLFEPHITDTRIVHSSQKGLLQHSLASWQIEYGDLALAEQNDPNSVWINKLMNDWIESIPQQDRSVFIAEVFDALSAEGAESLEDLNPDRLQTVLIKLTGVSETTRKTMAKLPNKLLFDDAIPPVPQTKAEKLKKLVNDQRVQAPVMVLLGVALFFMSGLLFELTTMIVVTVMTVIQLVLTVRRLIKQHGRFDELRGRIFILIAMLALAAILYFKEQAVFLIGSGLYGILCLVLAYYAVGLGIKQKEQPFLRVLNFVEGAVIGLFGIGFLLIPQSVVRPFAIALAASVALDGLIRFGYWFTKYLIRRRQKTV